MARLINMVKIHLHPYNKPALAVVKGQTLHIGISPDSYVDFAKFVQEDLNNRFPWHRHPLYQWARHKSNYGTKP